MMVRDLFFTEDARLVLCIVDSFHGASDVFKRVKHYDDHWEKVALFNKRDEALKYAAKSSCDFLFTDSDVGAQIYLSLVRFKIANQKARICVYEEGLGTYRDDIYSPLKRKLFSVLGIGAGFGACSLTDDVYLFDKDAYSKMAPQSYHKVRTISPRLADYVVSSSCLANIFGVRTALQRLSNAESSSSCLIYLSSWLISDSALTEINSVASVVKVLKLHPHITSEAGAEFSDCFDYVVEPGLPAEILLLAASEKFKRVIVYHHGSSIVRYIDSENISFVDLGWNLVKK